MQTIISTGGGIGFINTDTSKIFIWQKRDHKGIFKDYTNSTYNDELFPAGTVIGQVTSGTNAGKLVPFTSTATDGSQYVKGILLNDLFVPAGASITGMTIYICVEGDVASYGIALQGSDTLQTVCANQRTIEDKIGAETVGINLIRTVNMTDYNNT
jgi:hypothetical protein